MNIIRFCLLLVCLNFLVACGGVNVKDLDFGDRSIIPPQENVYKDTKSRNLTEVAAPKIIKKLNRDLEQYNPQVKIIAPKAEQILNDTSVSVRLEVKDFPVFRDDKLMLGNHLDLILDNEPSQAIYSLEEPLILKDLKAGTHTIRVFASRPWGESFKNEGAYAQVTFSVLTKTNDNRPNSDLPLLTYGHPSGTYGAEPLLLDFYLTNVSSLARVQRESNLWDWRIKATINGESFFLQDWRSIYLQGLKPGVNWIQLELTDEAGKEIKNAFNNTVRVINYDPTIQDSLAQLITNQIPLAQAKSIVEQNYYIQPVGTPEIIEIPVDKTVELTEEIEDSNQEISKTSPEIVESETTAKTAEQASNSIDSIDQTDLKLDLQELVDSSSQDNSESENIASEEATTVDDREKIKDREAEPKPPTDEIVITEIESEQSSPLNKIEIPQPESVKITEDKIEIVVP